MSKSKIDYTKIKEMSQAIQSGERVDLLLLERTIERTIEQVQQDLERKRHG